MLENAPWSRSIDEDQRFALKLDAPATRESVEAHAVVRVAGLPDPIGLRIVEGADRDAILASLDWEPDDPRLLVLEARQRFAPGAKLTLSWGAGIATATGVATEKEQVFEYEVRPLFNARLWCERENAKAACVPLRRFSLSFSSAGAVGDGVAHRAAAGRRERRAGAQLAGAPRRSERRRSARQLP